MQEKIISPVALNALPAPQAVPFSDNDEDSMLKICTLKR
jgi:hypothetical protein